MPLLSKQSCGVGFIYLPSYIIEIVKMSTDGSVQNISQMEAELCIRLLVMFPQHQIYTKQPFNNVTLYYCCSLVAFPTLPGYTAEIVDSENLSVSRHASLVLLKSEWP